MSKNISKPQTIIPQSGFNFLKKLKKNNNRDWFNANKDIYLKELEHIELFASELLSELNKHDVIETPSGKKSLHRIYRDIRFSKEKTPYKTNWSGSFRREGKQRRGGYYFHIESGNSFIAGGFWGPSPDDLKRIREDIAYDPMPIRKILKNKHFITMFGTLQGEQIKTAPKGFEPNDPAIDLLRYKQFLAIRYFTDKEVLNPDFSKEAAKTFLNMRPFFDYMSEVLSSDTNGIST